MRIRYSAWCHMTLKTVTSESGWSWIWAIDNYISDHFLHIREKSRQRAEGQGTRGGRLVSTPDLEPGCRLVSTPDLEPGCRLVSTPDLETGCGFRANHAFLGSPALAGTWSQSWGAPRPGLTGVLSTQFLLKCPTAPPSAHFCFLLFPCRGQSCEHSYFLCASLHLEFDSWRSCSRCPQLFSCWVTQFIDSPSSFSVNSPSLW